MNRILILLASLLVVAPVLALDETNGAVFSEQARKYYVSHNCYYDDMSCALAISKDGAFGVSTQNHPESAKYNALLQCRMIASKPETCEIVDINAESDFITRFTDQRTTRKEFKECYEAFHNPKPYTFGSPAIKTWSDAIKHSNSGNNTRPEVDALKVLCRSFVSEDHLTWTAPSLEEIASLQSGNTTQTDMGTAEKECQDLFLRQDRAIWRNDWGQFDFDVSRCDEYVSADGSTWVGAKIDDPDSTSVDLEFWQSVKDSDNKEMLRAYLDEFPDGKFRSLAQIKLKQLAGSEEADATVSIDEPVKQTIDLSGYWEVEHTIGSSAGAVEPYTLIVQLAQDGNSVSSVTVVELQTSESISCNGNGGPFDVNGAINGDAFTKYLHCSHSYHAAGLLFLGIYPISADDKSVQDTVQLYSSRCIS